MALCASGAMSLGGATTGRSVNLELGCSATASINMNRTDVRALAEKTSGCIRMSDFYGKSSAPPPPTTLGTYYTDFGGYYTGTQSGYYLFASTFTTGSLKWKTTQTTSAGTTSTTDGYSNTYAQKNAAHPLFNCVGSLTTAGFSDWYVGARCELQQQYNNRACGSLNGTYPNCRHWASTEINAGQAFSLTFVPNYWQYSNKNDFNIHLFCTRPIRRYPI